MTSLINPKAQLLDNFQQDILKFIKEQYAATKPLTPEEENQFDSNKYIDNLLDYIQFSKRWIVPKPRKVEYSNALNGRKRFSRILREIKDVSLRDCLKRG